MFMYMDAACGFCLAGLLFLKIGFFDRNQKCCVYFPHTTYWPLFMFLHV